jgi:hypothetical protein
MKIDEAKKTKIYNSSSKKHFSHSKQKINQKTEKHKDRCNPLNKMMSNKSSINFGGNGSQSKTEIVYQKTKFETKQ